MSRWFRMYDELLDDPKVQRLPPELFKAWVNLLALTSRNRGSLPPVDDVAFALRVDADTAANWLKSLVAHGLLSSDGGALRPHNWDRRQFRSDGDPTAAERQARKRARDKAGDCHGASRVTSRSPETDTDTEADKTNTPSVCVPSAPPPVPSADEPVSEAVALPPESGPAPADVAAAITAYNELASEMGWPRAERITAQRRQRLRQILRSEGLGGWWEALGKARDSPFLAGRTGRRNGHENWRPDLDFFLQPKSFVKLMEGGYDAR